MPSIRSRPQTALSFPLSTPSRQLFIHFLLPPRRPSSHLVLLHNADAHLPATNTQDARPPTQSAICYQIFSSPSSPILPLLSRQFVLTAVRTACLAEPCFIPVLPFDLVWPLRSSSDRSDPNDAPSPYRWAQSALLDRVGTLSPLSFSAGRPLVVSRSLDLPTKRAAHSRPSLHAFQLRSSHKQSPLSHSRPLAADATSESSDLCLGSHPPRMGSLTGPSARKLNFRQRSLPRHLGHAADRHLRRSCCPDKGQGQVDVGLFAQLAFVLVKRSHLFSLAASNAADFDLRILLSSPNGRLHIYDFTVDYDQRKHLRLKADQGVVDDDVAFGRGSGHGRSAITLATFPDNGRHFL
ncbi:hypothetical protein ONZ51_g11296 [Trametes cubensis]|uniref:Uncharacterized protein n=1 Tax=Trametes cubensis TaxID=1111947 RepID=A0AAD7X5J7_9APHY|nr:hypothetical protein ONZ51_g11296 [Trametes cubensis]